MLRDSLWGRFEANCNQFPVVAVLVAVVVAVVVVVVVAVAEGRFPSVDWTGRENRISRASARHATSGSCITITFQSIL